MPAKVNIQSNWTLLSEAKKTSLQQRFAQILIKSAIKGVNVSQAGSTQNTGS